MGVFSEGLSPEERIRGDVRRDLLLQQADEGKMVPQ